METQKNTKKRLAIVCSGGGMRGTYGAGALVALAEEHDIRVPDIAVAGSASAGSVLYYLTGQYGEMKRIWLDLLPSSRFISLTRVRKIVDIDYLVGRVFKQLVPLNVERLKTTTCRYFISVFNATDKVHEYYSNKDVEYIFNILCATKAMPLLYGKQIMINGDYYKDLYGYTKLSKSIKKAFDEKAEVVIMIDNSIGTFLVKKWLSKDPRTIHISPSAPLRVYWLTKNEKKLRRAFNMGYNDVKNNPRLKELSHI